MWVGRIGRIEKEGITWIKNGVRGTCLVLRIILRAIPATPGVRTEAIYNIYPKGGGRSQCRVSP